MSLPSHFHSLTIKIKKFLPTSRIILLLLTLAECRSFTSSDLLVIWRETAAEAFHFVECSFKINIFTSF